MTKHAWSPYQEAVFNEVENGTGHVLITARAGCAKTTTIVEAANRLNGDKQILMCAFNKEIANELSSRVLGHVNVSTLHSLGFKTLKRAWKNLGIPNVELGPTRERDVIKEVMKRAHANAEWRADLTTLIRMAKAFVVEDAASLLRLMEKYDCYPDGDPEEMVPLYTMWAQEALKKFREPNPMITFDDMLYVPAYHKMTTGRNHFVFVDETQDLNTAQLILASHSVTRSGRIIFVGDDRQAIYGFRGADETTIPKIREIYKAKELKLTRTYRCPKKIVALAQNFVPDFEAAPTAPEGVLERVNEKFMKDNWAPGDFVIARVNAVLVSLCLEALAEGIPAYMVGRDIGAGLIKLIEKSKAFSIDELVAWVREWQQSEMQKIVAADEEESKLTAVSDKANSLIRLAREVGSVHELISFINSLFGEEKMGGEARPRLAFMSCHKAKGLENGRVWLIDSSFRPGRGREEDNLYYVGITRAQRELYLVTMPKKASSNDKKTPLKNELSLDGE